MNYIFIHKGNNTVNFYLSCDGVTRGYNGYSIREAVRLFRSEIGLRYKHNVAVIDNRF